MLIASSQPFYPLYVWYFVNAEAALVSLLTFLSTPFFALVPWLARRNATWGKAFLVVTGSANTFACVKYFGASSAVETFLLPCAMLAAAGFRAREYWMALTLLAAGLAAFLLLRGTYGAPLAALEQADIERLANLNIYSVAVLTAYIGWTYAAARAQEERAPGLR